MTLARFVANSNRRPGIGDVMARLWALIVLGRRSTMGHRVCVYGRPIIDSAGELVIGSRTQIFARQARTELVVEASATLSIGEQCLVMDGATIAATELVEIGDRVLIGRGVSIIDNGYHELAVGRRLERPASQRVRIGNDVWIGTRAMVLPGATIGDGSVVGAGAVVVDEVPPGVVVGGVPATVLKAVPLE